MANFLRFSRLVSDRPPRPGVRVSVFLSVHTFRSLWLPPARWLMFHFALCYLISSKTLPWPSVSLSTSSWPPLTCDWMLSLWPIPVCSGCCNKLRFTDRWLLWNRNLLLTGLEAAKSKLRCPQIRCLVQPTAWVTDGCLLAASPTPTADELGDSGGLGRRHTVPRVPHPGRHGPIRRHFGDSLSPAAKPPNLPTSLPFNIVMLASSVTCQARSTSVTDQPMSPARGRQL